jgi:hypothetical protein
MEMLYFVVGYVLVWAVVLLVGIFSLYMIVYSVAYAVRAARIIKYVGKNKTKPYWLCLWLVFKDTLGDVPGATSYNGRYFPLWKASYYPDFEEDEED